MEFRNNAKYGRIYHLNYLHKREFERSINISHMDGYIIYLQPDSLSLSLLYQTD